MRLYAIDALEDGTDYLAPHALNAEAEAAVTRSNRLDRWALAGRLAHDRIATDTFGRVRHDPISTTQTYTLNTDQPGSVSLVPVLDAAGNAWTQTVTVRGGYLEVSVHVDLDVADPAVVWRPVVMVNGLRGGQGPTTQINHNGRDVAHATEHVPVAAGRALVEVFVEVCCASPSTATITFRDRQLLIVEACR